MESNKKDGLRQKAEEIIKNRGKVDFRYYSKSLEELVEELQVYQVELEHQNDELVDLSQRIEISQKRIVDLFNHMPTGYITLDEDYRIVEINQTLSDILEEPAADLYGRNFTQFIDKNSQDNFYLYFKGLIKKPGTYQTTTITLKLPSQAINFFQLRSYAEKEIKKQSLQVRLSLMNLTTEKIQEEELKKKNKENEELLKKFEHKNHELENALDALNSAHAQIKESEEKYRLLHENAGIGIGYFNTKGQVIAFNKIAQKMVPGMNGFEGKSIIEIFPEQGKEFLKRIKKVVKTGITEVFEDELKINDQNHWYLNTYSLIKDKENKIFGVQILSHNISLQKNAEIELRQHNQRLELLQKVNNFKAKSLHDLLRFAINEMRKDIPFDDAAFYLFNAEGKTFQICSESENSRKPFNKLILAATIPKSSFQKMKSGNEISGTQAMKDLEFVFSSKKANFSGYHVFPILAQNQLNALVIVFNKGKHELSNADSCQFQQLIMGLWPGVEKQQMQEALKREKEHAEESDRLKSAFLANMSHEIRTPMNGIMGFSEMFLNDMISEEKRHHYARLINSSSERLLNIINNILDISKIETGVMQVSNEMVNLNEMILELFSFYKVKAQEKGIAIFPFKQLKDVQSNIYTDKTKLYQILNNLLSNAFKFTHEGFIKFGYQIHHQNKDMLQFFVKDTGIGIAQDQQKNVFERFRQAAPDLNRKYGGTGLGLSIAQKFVELLGGTIYLESETEKGTTFYFTIPFQPVYKSEVKFLEEKNGHSKELKKQVNILIAEDEEINLIFLDELLRNMGINTIHAYDGVEAVEICRKNLDIDLVLMDIRMPHLNGLAATRMIKSFRPDLPIIAQTAYAMDSDRDLALSEGCDSYLSKPIKSEDIKKIIEQYFEL